MRTSSLHVCRRNGDMKTKQVRKPLSGSYDKKKHFSFFIMMYLAGAFVQGDLQV